MDFQPQWLERIAQPLAGLLGTTGVEGWLLPIVAVLCVALLLSWGRRALRGEGDLAVVIELAPERRGSFSVRVRRGRERRPPLGPEALMGPVAEARRATRFEHTLVGRETHFRAIPARTYWVSIEGLIESWDGEPPRAVFEDREIEVRRGRAVRADFDLRPRAAVVEVHVVRGGRPAREARIAIGGDPTSLRLARGGIARLPLGRGRHVVLAGAGDRAIERDVEIETLERRTLVVELEAADDLAFQGCESAVEPFLRGDLSVAASALERSGQPERAHLLAARFHRERGAPAEAAEHFEAAGQFALAAELRAEANQPELAARLFERADDLARAAEMHQAAGDLLRAGRCHEQAGDLDAAAGCYREAGAAPRLLDVLEKQGRHFQSGELALEAGDARRAVRNFQQVSPREAGFVRACRVLADQFLGEGKAELAIQKADEAMSLSREDESGPEVLAWYGDLLARAGRPDRALAVFEGLREHGPPDLDLGDGAGVETRIEELRKQVSEVRRLAISGSSGGAAAALRVSGALGSERYELLEEIGAGGMGVVYRARDKRLGREVALKRLPDSLKENPRAVELFLREARAAAKLNHANIVTVHDVDELDGHYFITMELLVGTPLSDALRARGRIAADDCARIGLQIATGLAYAHSQRIVHRDIKTANLFFTHDRVVKIMDFGLAKMLEEVRRASTVIGGTPYYMAPEQAVGGVVDHRADLYSFGATLFEMLTGRPPFTDGDVAYHHRHTPAPDPRSRLPELSAAWAGLVAALLAKDPEQRPASADEVARRLRECL